MELGSMRIAATIAALATLTHGCGGGSGSESEGPLASNHHPILRTPNPDQAFAVDHPFEYDVLQGGTTFVDPDGDSLSYSVNMIDDPLGMNVSGSRIAGPATETGVVVIEVIAEDGHSASARDSFEIRIVRNRAPTAVHPNPHLLVAVGENINHDATQAGTTFQDVDGDPLTYEMTIEGSSQGLTATGSHVVGSMQTIGLARVKVSAADGYGGIAENEFSIAAPAAEPGKPTLPAVPFTYADDELPLPYVYREQREFGVDTTPSDNETTNAGAALGRVLFYDRRLSITNTHACSSCHNQALAFSSPDRFSVGVLGVPLKRHAMPLSNVRFNRDNRFFSDMRVVSLEQLVLMPIEQPLELGQPLELLEAKLASTDFYPPLFEAAFGDPQINRTRISRAIAQFLRSLVSYRSRFDRAHYTTDPQVPVEPGNQLTAQEQRGFDLFIFSRCHFCHKVPAHDISRPANNGLDETITDPGTIEGLGWFRAPSIRNVAVSAPYMHDGRFATLREVIDHYDSGVKMNPGLDFIFLFNGEVRRLNLTEDDKAALEAFLNTLTDDAFLGDPKFSDPFVP